MQALYHTHYEPAQGEVHAVGGTQQGLQVEQQRAVLYLQHMRELMVKSRYTIYIQYILYAFLKTTSK